MTTIKKQGIIKSSAVLMVSVAVGKAAGLIFKIFLANILGGTGMGYFSGAYAVFTPLYALCAGSLTPAVAQLVSENEARRSPSRVRGVRTAALRIFALPGLLMSVLPMVFAGILTERFIGSPGAKYAVIAILPCVFLGTVTAILRGYFEGLRNMTPTALSQITESVVRVTAGLGLSAYVKNAALLEYSESGTVFGHACPSLAYFDGLSLPYIAAAAVFGVTLSEVSSFLFMIVRTRLGSDGIDKSLKPREFEIRGESKRLLRLIIPISAAGIVGSLAGTVDLYTIISGIKSSLARHPELYIEKYAGALSSGVALKELPNYLYGSFTGLAGTVFGLAPSLCSVFGKSALPAISEAWSGKDLPRVSREIRRVLTVNLFISVPAGLGLSVLSRDILGLLFSSRVHEVDICALPLSVMALGTAFVTAGGACFPMLQAVGRPDLPIIITIIGAVTRLGLNIILVPIPSLGLVGAALASLISGGVIFMISMIFLLKITHTKLKPFIMIGLPLLSSGLACAGAIYILKTSKNYLPMSFAVLFSVGFAVISYIFFLLLLDISTKNRFKAEIFGK